MSGQAILIVEDEMLVALSLAADLEAANFTVAGPVVSVEQALDLIERNALAGAFLDMNLGNGTDSTPIAQELERRNVPFVFLTGYSESSLRKRDFESRRFLSKPISPGDLIDAAKTMTKAS